MPDLVLNDEATGNPDSRLAEQVFDAIRESIRDNHTIALMAPTDPDRPLCCDGIVKYVDVRLVLWVAKGRHLGPLLCTKAASVNIAGTKAPGRG